MWNPEEKGHLGDPGVDMRITLIGIFRKWDVGVWTGSIWLGRGQAAGIPLCGNEISGFIECGRNS